MNQDQLHLFFFPLMAHGHMLPMLDTAKLFASRGVKATIITTPGNASVFTKRTDDQTNKGKGNEVSLHIINFPGIEVGLPQGCECIDEVTSPDMVTKFGRATLKLQKPLEQLLQEFCPHGLVADAFFPWATKVAAKCNIPILVFHVSSIFAQCASHSMIINKPFKNASSDAEPFIIPNLPHEIKLTKLQVDVHEQVNEETGFTMFLDQRNESELSSNGAIFNSFYELEPNYADHYRDVLKRKGWLLGPVSLCNRELEDKAQRGKKSDIDQHECLKWLDSKKPNSVIYVCFGSHTNFAYGQLKEIASGIEASEQDFIWVVRKGASEEWLPEGFEERMKGKGLIVSGWAPQVLILDHEAIGAFVTHCGWNSTLEGVSAGVPMVTCPFFAEQFYNEKLVTDVLRTGVSAGVEKFSSIFASEVVLKKDGMEKAVKRIMVGQEAEEIRSRAKALKGKAKMAVDEGGSSYSNLTALIEELTSYDYSSEV